MSKKLKNIESEIAGFSWPGRYGRVAAAITTIARGRIFRHGDYFQFECRDDIDTEDMDILHSFIHIEASKSGGRFMSAAFCGAGQRARIRVSFPQDPIHVRRGEHTYNVNHFNR